MMLACKTTEVNDREKSLSEFLQHIDALYGFAIRLTPTMNDAEDLTQDTFLRAVRYIDHYEEGTNTRSWLFKIMHNLFINQYRKGKKSPFVAIADTNEFYFDIPVKPDVYQNSFSDEVMLAFNRLKPEMKTVLFLCDVENLKYIEISQILNIPVCTVKTRIHRARAFIKKLLLESGFHSRNN